MRVKCSALIAIALTVPLTLSAQKIVEIPLPPSQNQTNAALPISGAVWADNTLYLSGWLDPDMKTHPDMKSQTIGVLSDIQKFLKSQKLTLANVVMIHVYLGVDPATDGKPNGAAMTEAYVQFFGTKENPRKPARTTTQVVLPAGARGALIEIDLVAVRGK